MSTQGLLARFKPWLIDVAVGVLLVAWYYRFGLRHLSTDLYDTFDQKAMIYLMEWIHHSVFGAGHFSELFDANILHPNKNVLAWSDTMLGFAPIYSPLRFFTDNPILALNLVVLVGAFGAALGMLRLGRELFGDTSAIAAVVGALGLFVSSQEGHFQFKSLGLLIWALYFLVRFLRGSPLAIVGVIVLGAWLFLSSVYLTIMLVVLLVNTALFAAVVWRKEFFTWLRARLVTLPRVAVTVATVVSLVPVIWVLRHYLQVQKEFGSGYELESIVTYSGRPGSLLDASGHSLLYKPQYGYWGAHEARLWLGATVWFGMLLLFAGWPWQLDQRARRVAGVLVFGVVMSLVLSMGPYQRDLLDQGIHVPLPGWLYAKGFPGYAVLRTAGRWGYFAAIFGALLAELAVRQLLLTLAPTGWRLRASYPALALLFVLDQTSMHRPTPVNLWPRRGVYEGIAAKTPEGAAVVELPVIRGDHMTNVSWQHEQMLGSLLHWRRVPAGFTSLQSRPLEALQQGWREVADGAPVERLLLETSKQHLTFIVVNDDLLDEALSTRLKQELTALGWAASPLTEKATLFAAPPEATPR